MTFLLALVPERFRLLAEILLLCGALAGVWGWVEYGKHHAHELGLTEGRAEVQAKWNADRVTWQAALSKQKLEATQMLADETAKVTEAERRFAEFRNNQEHTDANHEAAVNTLSRQLAGQRLRDPFAKADAAGRGCGGGGAQDQARGSAGDRPADGAAPAGLLSEGFAGLLRDWTLKSDRINNAYTSCRGTAVNDRKVAP